MSLKIKGPNRNNNRPFTKDYTSQFRDFLSTHGYEPDPNKGLVTDGSIGRAYINIGNQRKLVGWYQAWLDQSSPTVELAITESALTNPRLPGNQRIVEGIV